MTKEITVQGIIVSVATPYAPGHVITEAEAKALNQVRAENIGNNSRKQLQELIEAAGGADAITDAVRAAAQAIVTERDANYEFTLASVGAGRAPVDPLDKECLAVAKSWLMGKLKEAGTTLKAYTEKNGEEAVKAKLAEVAAHPDVIKLAKKNLKDREGLAGLDL